MIIPAPSQQYPCSDQRFTDQNRIHTGFGETGDILSAEDAAFCDNSDTGLDHRAQAFGGG